ncbi:hypothetical protein CMV_018070 [Castanea mollissima]|uniref:Uncharacterized protein n=1 Tax=Castanea mollissima TaxID=60419 RepID=A0A8J4VPX9_9ROSI|nr:hypothetical protein CMV_018070 [Castanea mollissima]
MLANALFHVNSKATKGGRKVIARRIARAGQELRLSILASGMGRMAFRATLLMYSKVDGGHLGSGYKLQ